MTLDLERALRYPTEDDDWVETIVIGGLLLLFSPFLVPLFAAYGYGLRAIRAGIREDEEPPAFEEWKALIVDGLKVTAIAIVYQLVPLFVLIVFVGGSVLSLLTGAGVGGTGGGLFAGLGVLGFLGGLALYGLLAILFGYVGVAGILHFASTGELSDAFDVSAIKRLVFSGDYLVAWGFVLALSFGVNVVVSVISTMTLGIGGLLAPWPTFYVMVVGAFVWGRSYGEVFETGTFEEE